MDKNNSALFFTCSVIELIGRMTKNKRQDVVDYLGKEDITRLIQTYFTSPGNIWPFATGKKSCLPHRLI